MKIKIIHLEDILIAEIQSEEIEIRNAQDALDILANCSYQGAYCIILREANIIPGFFDLKTRIAGNVLQKFSTYQVRLAIIGDFSKYTSKSLNDFISESNRTGRINFVDSLEHAKEALLKFEK